MTGYLGKTAKAPVKTPEDQQEIDAEVAARLAAIRKKKLKQQLLILGGWATGMGILTVMRVLRHRKFNAQYKVTPAQLIRRRFNLSPYGSDSDVGKGKRYASNKEWKKRRIARGESWPPTGMIDIRGNPWEAPPGHWDIP